MSTLQFPQDEGTFPLLRAAQILCEAQERRWLIEGLWGAAAVGIIGGSPKCCKSWLSLEMAVSLDILTQVSRLLEDPLDHTVMETKLTGDRADAPLLRVVQASDTGLVFRRNHEKPPVDLRNSKRANEPQGSHTAGTKSSLRPGSSSSN